METHGGAVGVRCHQSRPEQARRPESGRKFDGGSWMRRRWRRTAAGRRSRAGNETGRGRRRSGTLEIMGSFPTVAED